MENPFDNPTTIRDPESFVGREYCLERILGQIKNKQNASLVGPKRIGKTSLLTRLQNETLRLRTQGGKKILFFYLDLQRRSMKGQVNLFDDINRTLRTQYQGELAEIAGKDDELRRDDEFIALLDNYQQRELHPVLIMDTFDEIARYGEIDIDMFGVLRSQGNAGQISYITASVETLGEIFKKRALTDAMVSSFYNIFSINRLAPFSPVEACTLLNNYSARAGLPFSAEEVKAVREMAGDHPYLLQQVAALLFEEKRARGPEQINFSRVRKEALQNLSSHFEDCWNMLDNEKRQKLIEEVLRAEVDDADYPELSMSRLFRDYLQDTEKLDTLPVSELSITELTKILDNLSDVVALGKSALIRLPFIAAQLRHEGAETAEEKGRIVRKLVNKALDKLRGEGERKNTNEWLSYNVLYFRYFYSNLPGKQLAARLGISERQYYRERDVAIKKLQQMLQGLEVDIDAP